MKALIGCSKWTMRPKTQAVVARVSAARLASSPAGIGLVNSTYQSQKRAPHELYKTPRASSKR